MIAVGLMAPPWLSAIAKGDMVRIGKGKNIDPDTVLIVCQLTGGNDGLNTVIPHALDAYYKARPVIGIPADKVLKIDQNVGFHPAMTGMHTLFQEKKVAIVQAAGYPNPNRSHFKSMDIWHSASPDGRLNDGWIGRAIDLKLDHGAVDPIAAVGLSNEKPRALIGRKASIPCFASLTDIQSMVGDADSEKMLRDIQGMDATQGSVTRQIQDSSRTALDAMASLKAKLATFTPKQTYGKDIIARICRCALLLLRRHPVVGAEHLLWPCKWRLFGIECAAEVSDLGAAGCAEEHVAGVQIPVDDPKRMGGHQAAEHIRYDAGHTVALERGASLRCGQRSAG